MVLNTRHYNSCELCSSMRKHLKLSCFPQFRPADTPVLYIALDSIIPRSLYVYGNEVLSRELTVEEMISDL